MNPESGSRLSEAEGPAVAKDGRFSFTVWIEQLQELDDARSVTPDPIGDWEDACLPYPSVPTTREDLRDLGRQLIQLAKRMRALEQRSSVLDPRSGPLS